MPAAAVVALPTIATPSYKVIVAPSSAEPVKVGVRSSVMSLSGDPRVEAAASTGAGGAAGAVVSTARTPAGTADTAPDKLAGLPVTVSVIAAPFKLMPEAVVSSSGVLSPPCTV